MKYFSRHLYISIQTEIFSAICHTKRDFPRLSFIKTLLTTQQRTSKIYSLLFLKYQTLINRYRCVEQKTEVISTIQNRLACWVFRQYIGYILKKAVLVHSYQTLKLYDNIRSWTLQTGQLGILSNFPWLRLGHATDSVSLNTIRTSYRHTSSLNVDILRG